MELVNIYKNDYIKIQNNEVSIDGVIGNDLFNEGYTFNQFKRDVKNIKGKIIINIASMGGSLIDALSIYDFIRSMDNKVITKIISTSASSATIISLAGDRRYIAKNSRFLIHKPWLYFTGNSSELEKILGDLKELDDQLINLYVSRSKLNYDQVLDLMLKETFISAEKALEYGFVDDYIKDKKELNNDMDKKLLEMFNTEDENDVLSNVLNLLDENARLKNTLTISSSQRDANQVEEEEDEEEVLENEEVKEDDESTETENEDKSTDDEEVLAETDEEADEESIEDEEADDEEKAEETEEVEEDEGDDSDPEKEKLLARIVELEKLLKEKEEEEAEENLLALDTYLNSKVEEGRITNHNYDSFYDVGADKGLEYVKNIIEKLPMTNTKLSKYIDPDLTSKSKKELYNMWRNNIINADTYLNLTKVKK